jgi:hypothetical protein
MSAPTGRRLRLDADLSLTVLVGVIAAAALVETREWEYGARLLPQVVATLALLVVTLRVVSRLVRPSSGSGPAAEDPWDLPEALVDGVTPDELRRRARRAFLWIVTFLGAGVLFGLQLAIPVYLMAYLLRAARLRLWTALLITALTTGLLIGVFGELLGMRVPAALLF